MEVLLYWPNIVGYTRISLVFAAWAACETPALFMLLYSVFTALDGKWHPLSWPTCHDNSQWSTVADYWESASQRAFFLGVDVIKMFFFIIVYLVVSYERVDGWLARKFGQTSRLGAWLDVVVDNLGRGMLWSLLSEWGWLVSSLEWCVFVCNHNTRGDQWKNSFTSSPCLIQAIMANGFRTPLGVWVVSGLHCLPLWLYAYDRGLLSSWLDLPLWIQVMGTLLLAVGRLLALSAEVWCIWTHIKYLLSDEPEKKN